MDASGGQRLVATALGLLGPKMEARDFLMTPEEYDRMPKEREEKEKGGLTRNANGAFLGRFEWKYPNGCPSGTVLTTLHIESEPTLRNLTSLG